MRDPEYDLIFIGAGLATLIAVNDLMSGGYDGKIVIVDKGAALKGRKDSDSPYGWGGRAYKSGFEAIDWEYVNSYMATNAERFTGSLYNKALTRLCSYGVNWAEPRETLIADNDAVERICRGLEKEFEKYRNVSVLMNKEATDVFCIEDPGEYGDCPTHQYIVVLGDEGERISATNLVCATDLGSGFIRKAIERFKPIVWTDVHVENDDNWERDSMPLTYFDGATTKKGMFVIGDCTSESDDLVWRVFSGMQFASYFLKDI